MNKVVVELESLETRGISVADTNRSNNTCRPVQYEGWVTVDYVASQLRQDVAHFWDLDATKYELLDGITNAVVADDTCLDSLTATTYVLRKRRDPSLNNYAGNSVIHNRDDPFWLQEKLFDVFLIHALPHWNGKGGITMSCYQFKQLVLKAMANASKKSSHELTVRMVLAFKSATPNYSGAGATFDEFLDALMDVATFLFPRLSSGSKEYALERLGRKYLIPYYDQLERTMVYQVFPTWSMMDELVLVRPKVKQLLLRFAQPLFEIALAYTTSVKGPRHQRGLRFQEFSRLVHDIKPRAVPLNTLQICFCFIHCCRIELSNGFMVSAASTTDAFGSLAGLHAGVDGSGRGVLEISCAHAAHAIAYLALLSMPSLALTKPCISHDNQHKQSHADNVPIHEHGRVRSVVASLAVKAFLHCMSLRLASTGRATAIAVASATPRFASARKDTTLPLVSVNFLQEFHRMHREDALDDYLSSCGDLLRRSNAPDEDQKRYTEDERVDVEQQRDAESPSEDAQRPEQEDDPSNLHQDIDEDLGLEIDWGEEENEEVAEENEQSISSENDASPSELARESDDMSPETMSIRQDREQEVLRSMMNDADEIYTFLVSELQHHATEGKLDDAETVPQMLDIWVTAGQKYAQVINYLDSLLQDAGKAEERLFDRKVRVLERFGASLYVFAMQLLKTTSKVFNYEEIFHITNARVYNHVTADLWDGPPSTPFTTDLATETLSLASGKLGTACKVLEELHRLFLTREKKSGTALLQTVEHTDNGNDLEVEEDTARPLTLTERYMQTLVLRANCLDVYGDVLGHTKRGNVDFDLGCAIEEDHEQQRMVSTGTTSQANDTASVAGIRNFYSSNVVLSKTSSAGQFYREAKRIYRYVLTETTRLGWHGPNDRFESPLTERLANVEFKLAAHLPRGCVAEKHLLDHALQRVATLECPEMHPLFDELAKDRLHVKRTYISAIRALRSKFFQPETDKTSYDDVGSDAIVPFYRFVLVGALREVDPSKTGTFNQSQLSQFNQICGHIAVSDLVMAWLVKNFDHLEDSPQPTLTEKGVFQYFCWLAESDPFTFCEVLDLLTAKYTETPVSISSGIASPTGKEVKAKSLRATLFNRRGKLRQSASAVSPAELLSKTDLLNGIADCVVVVSAKMIAESGGEISQTASPSDVKLDASIVDVLPLGADVPEELSKFCFPDDVFMSSEPLQPKAFDIVLTDITGERQYGSCLHFVEERDPIDVLAMISGMQRGNKTPSLPSWISLKDIQQRRAKSKFFIPKCLCILSRLPLFQTLRECLATIYRLSISFPPFPIESFILHILEQVPIPVTPNSITSFTLVNKVGILTSLPPAVPPFYPTEVDFTLLFQCLSTDNIVKVYGYLLTEKKLVLTSRNVAILTPCAETLRALLYPFEYQAVYIPVLPLALLDFVTAPVPFFMGVCSDVSMDRLTGEGVVVVNLDRDEISEPSTESLPVMPDAATKKLIQSLRKASAWATGQFSRSSFGRYQNGELSEITSYTKLEVSDGEVSHKYQLQEDIHEKWTEISVLFTTFVMRLLKDFRKYSQRGTNDEGRETTAFDRKAFLAMHPNQREFCVHLFQTQHFQRFVETSASLSESVLQLGASNAEQSWRTVRSSIISRRGDTSDISNVKTPTPLITRAPPLTQLASGSARNLSGGSHLRRPSGRYAGVEILAPFNSNVYDELQGINNNPQLQNLRELNAPSPVAPKPIYFMRGSSTTVVMSPRTSSSTSRGEATSSNLIVAARLRLDMPLENTGE